MLILEGPDCVGKTTLAKKCVEIANRNWNMPAVYRHFTRLPKCWRVRDYFDHIATNVVMDRFHMSEPIYAHEDARKSCISPEAYSIVDARLRLAGAFTVVICAEPGIITKRLQANPRAEMYDADLIERVNLLYRATGLDRGRGTHLPRFECTYRMDLDVCLCQQSENEYPTATQAELIVQLWQERRQRLESLAQ